MEPTFLSMGKEIVVYYSHFLVVVAVTVFFSWSISRLLVVLGMIINFILLSARKELMFLGLDVILFGIVIQINLKN